MDSPVPLKKRHLNYTYLKVLDIITDQTPIIREMGHPTYTDKISFYDKFYYYEVTVS